MYDRPSILKQILLDSNIDERIKSRAEIAWNYFENGYSVSYISDMLSVSRPTIYRWVKRYEEDGIDGLFDFPRSGRPPNKRPFSDVTAKELQVLKLASNGKTSWEISRILGISEKTVNTHFDNIKYKLDVNNRSFAVAEGFRRKLIS